MVNQRNPYVRYCEDCGKLYKPSGKYQRFCDKCVITRRKKTNEKMKQTMKNKFPKKMKNKNG